MLTDLSAECENLTVEGVSGTCYAHKVKKNQSQSVELFKLSYLLNWIHKNTFLCIAGHISSCKLHLQETSQWWYFKPGVQHCTCEFTQPLSGRPLVNLQQRSQWIFCDSYMCVCVCLYLQEYKLVITGHSLGAGTASLLAVLLRSTHPTLECYAFSPPGGLMR